MSASIDKALRKLKRKNPSLLDQLRFEVREYGNVCRAFADSAQKAMADVKKPLFQSEQCGGFVVPKRRLRRRLLR